MSAPQPVLRGIFLTSEAPAKTAQFYRDVAGVDLEQVGNPDTYAYWRIDRAGLQLAIHDAKAFAGYTYPARPDSNLTHLYFQIPSQTDFLAHLDRLEIMPLLRDDVVVTVVDPDGRKVMFGTA